MLDALGNLTKVFVDAVRDVGQQGLRGSPTAATGRYVELVGMMDAGPQKNALVRDAKAFDEKRKAAGCGK